MWTRRRRRFDKLFDMRTPSLSELRRVLGHALLAAPLAFGACKKEEPKDPGRGTGSSKPRPDAAQVQPDAAQAKKVCAHSTPDITGCGGAEVYLDEDPKNCGLVLDQGLPQDVCDLYCGDFDTRGCEAHAARGSAKPEVFCYAANPCLGRAPSCGNAVEGATDVDAHLALARRVEAHSVAAFRELGRDLARWGAPDRLRRACARAARDEARHAAAMTRLLRRRGVAPGTVTRAAATGFASLRDLALHNEREGVVGETWGALVAQHQAAHAADPEVRAAMATIADEETAHAQLAFEIAAWARERLGADELDAARADAVAELRASLGYRPADAAADELGWPSRAASAAMLDALAPAFA